MYLPEKKDAYLSNAYPKLHEPVIDALLSSKPLKRLAGIGFLGAIDYIRHGSGRSGHRRRHNRLEHSIGVAHLANIYARNKRLPDDRRLLLVCAALLHDVGHGPLSHTLEPVFSEEFGLNHHMVTRRIITGALPIGQEIPEILSSFGIDLEEVIALIDGEHDGEIGHLFSSQINFDTLEGINRCRAFIAPRSAFKSPERAVCKWAQKTSAPEAEFDDFWKLKHDVYNLFIGAPLGAALDAIAQTYMRANISKFSAEDFLITETTLRRRHPEIYYHLNESIKKNHQLRLKIPQNWKRIEVKLKTRTFYIDQSTRITDNKSLNKRYKQEKSTKYVTLSELMD